MKGSLATPRRALRQHRAPLGPVERGYARAEGGAQRLRGSQRPPVLTAARTAFVHNTVQRLLSGAAWCVIRNRSTWLEVCQVMIRFGLERRRVVLRNLSRAKPAARVGTSTPPAHRVGCRGARCARASCQRPVDATEQRPG